MIEASLAAIVRRLFVVATILPCGVAHSESWTIAPQLRLSETYSTNIALTSGPAIQGWITDIAPGIRVNGNGARVKGSLDYRFHSLRYAGNSDLNHNLNSLASFATVEAVENWLYLDTSANIVQRSRSAFDAVAADAASATANQSETTTIQLSPYIRGHISDIAAYRLRFSAISSRSDDASLANTRVGQWSGSLRNASTGAKVGWFINGNESSVRNDVIGTRSDTRLRGGLTVEALPRLHVSLSNGRERTDFATANMQTTATPGLGIEWSPSPRTQAAAQSERRFFGTAHSMLLNHRTGLTSWRYSDVKDVAILPALLAASGQGAIAELMSDLLAASVPNAAARAEAVRTRLDQQGTILPQAEDAGVQTSRLLLNHVREASVALINRRDTVTLSLIQRDEQAVGDLLGIIDSFALSNKIRERGRSVSWIHQLLPQTTLNLTARRLHSEGLSVANLRSSQLTHTASFSFRIGPQAYVSLGARVIRFDGTTSGTFHERAFAASLSQSF